MSKRPKESRIDKAAQKTASTGLAPASKHGQKFYKWGIVFSGVLLLLFVFAWAVSAQWFITQSALLQILELLGPAGFIILFSWSLLFALWLDGRPDHLLVANYGPIHIAASAEVESYRTFIWPLPRASIQKESLAELQLRKSAIVSANGGAPTVKVTRRPVRIQTYHAIRGGVYWGGGIQSPWGPVIISETRNRDYDKKLMEAYQKFGKVPRFPPREWAGKLHSYFPSGKWYVLPGAINKVIRLGSKRHDGYMDFREWIWGKWPNLSGWARLIIIMDAYPEEASELEKASEPSVHVTNAEAHAAYWEAAAYYYKEGGEGLMLSRRREKEILGGREDEIQFEET